MIATITNSSGRLLHRTSDEAAKEHRYREEAMEKEKTTLYVHNSIDVSAK